MDTNDRVKNMIYSENDLLPISALQHLQFCSRQCALIHIEQLWVENQYTVEGQIMHERVHSENEVVRKNVKISYGMPLRSLNLGIVGKADVIEFHYPESSNTKDPCEARVFPVEYKRGKPKSNDCDKVQLCAQALCLEEMLGITVNDGAIFYGKTRRRLDIVFDDILRQTTINLIRLLHSLIRNKKTPLPIYTEKCEGCSLYDLCLPKILSKTKNVQSYLMEEWTK